MAVMALLFCSAALYYCSFPNAFFIKGASLCAWGCAFPFFIALDGKNLRERFWLGALWGLLAHAALMAWLFPVSPAGWGLLTAALASQGIVFAVLFPSRETPLAVKLLLIPGAWVASEWARTLALGGFSWSLGYSQARVPEILQPAAFGGVYAVSWIVILANAACYLFWRTRGQKRRVWLAGVGIMMVVIVGGSLRILRAPVLPATLRVAAIQPNILKEDKVREDLYDANVMRHLVLTKKAATAGWLGSQDLVVWPETAFIDDVLTDMKWRPRLERAARGMGVNILVGSALLWNGYDLNSAALLSSAGDWKSVYHKVHLVPFAEFTPRGAERLAAWLRLGKYHFMGGSRPGNMVLPGGQRFGAVICSEELYPEMFMHLAAADAAFAVVMLNDGWFTRPEALYMHALAAPLRAIESGLSVVRVSNTGLTCAFDAYGRPLGRPPDIQRPDVAVFTLAQAGVRTFYARHGDVFALMCLVFVIMFNVFLQFKRMKARASHGAA